MLVVGWQRTFHPGGSQLDFAPHDVAGVSWCAAQTAAWNSNGCSSLVAGPGCDIDNPGAVTLESHTPTSKCFDMSFQVASSHIALY